MNEKCCTFFGHRSCPAEIKPKSYHILENLIANRGVTVFYIGNQGAFDCMARSVLRELCKKYPHITYTVVLAYLPSEHKDELSQYQDYSDTMYPDGIETVPKRLAIDWRNHWLLKQADYVVTYITHSWGGAAKFADLANKKMKKVYNLSTSYQICER